MFVFISRIDSLKVLYKYNHIYHLPIIYKKIIEYILYKSYIQIPNEKRLIVIYKTFNDLHNIQNRNIYFILTVMI